MSATLIAVVISLVLGHVMPTLVALRRYDWVVAWHGWLDKRLEGQSFWDSSWGLALGIGLPVVAVAVIQYLLSGLFFDLLSFLFGLAVLFYTWGPRDLDLDVEAVIEATDGDARRAAAAHLFPDGRPPLLEGGPLVEAVFRCALWRWFGPLFWFLLLGASGVLAYRLIALCAQGHTRKTLPDAQGVAAAKLLAVIEWPVAQLMILTLALAANFDAVIAAWRNAASVGSFGLAGLDAAARASVRFELAEEDAYAADGPAAAPSLLELRDAMSLVWRVLLIWLAALALFVLAGFVS